jgi:SAM-dependent methyltransferase
MPAFWKKLRWSIAQRGLLGTIKAAPAAFTRTSTSALQHHFDKCYGTDTSGLIGGASLAAGHPHDRYITAYSATAPSRFEAALNRWQSTLNDAKIEDYTFIDLGCGKGRALLLASRIPFREVIGIELNPQLAATAQRNAERWQSFGDTRCPMRVETGDATEPSLPAGPVLLYLYNSFAEPMVCHLADYIARSNHSCRIDLLYQNAYHAEVFGPNLGFAEVWRSELPLSPADASADPVASPNDITVQFRRYPTTNT